MSYEISTLKNALRERGELLLTLESDAYNTVELHLHDTTFYEDPDEVVVALADGEFSFKPDRVESMAVHKQTTDDLGI